MSESAVVVVTAATLVASILLTGGFRYVALARGLIDVPNARSSHIAPTPRGGGVAIVIAFLLAALSLAWLGQLPATYLFAFLGSGLLVGGIGWVDDHRHVSALWRLLVHFSAAAWGLAWLGGLPPLVAFGANLDLGWAGDALAAVYVVWLLNLYNFMDGIDGIAAVEAVTVCLSGLLINRLATSPSEAWAAAPVLAAAAAGFLPWNFPRARIFMGDAGSGFIGIAIALLSLAAARAAPELFWGWLILLGAFIVDATVTVIRRLLRGEAVYEAHRSHAYQHTTRKVGSHPPVTLAVGIINLMWLLPMAAMVASQRIDGAVGVLIAYLPLVALALWQGAGRPDESR